MTRPRRNPFESEWFTFFLILAGTITAAALVGTGIAVVTGALK